MGVAVADTRQNGGSDLYNALMSRALELVSDHGGRYQTAEEEAAAAGDAAAHRGGAVGAWRDAFLRAPFFREVTVPWGIANIQASILQLLPSPLLTRDQVLQLRSHNVVSAEAVSSGRTFAALGIQPQSIATILPSYLWRYRAAGQFQRKTEAVEATVPDTRPR